MTDSAHEHQSHAEAWRRRSPWLVAAAFSVSGVVHIVDPSVFTGIVPDFLPAKTGLVVVSGIAELICAAGLWRRAAWAGAAAALLLVVIWPANLQMALNAQSGHNQTTKIADWIRLPLQVPLIWCALQVPRTQCALRSLVARRRTDPR